MVEREFLRDLIRRTFTEWHQPAEPVKGEGGRATLTPVWLSLTEVYDTIRRFGTQLPGVGRDQINRITRDQVMDEMRSMTEIRRQNPSTPHERWALSTQRHP
jgi:hypothetical protein